MKFVVGIAFLYAVVTVYCYFLSQRASLYSLILNISMFLFWLLSFILTARFPRTVQYFITFGFISQCISAVLRVYLSCEENMSNDSVSAMQNLYPLFYYIMAVLLVNSNFVMTGYIMPFILFLSTWFMVSKGMSSEDTVLLMAFFTKILAFLLIGYYRMHKHFVKLFISQFESKRREEELQFMMDQQDHGVMVMRANRKRSRSGLLIHRLVFNNKSAADIINLDAGDEKTKDLVHREVFEFHCEADFVAKEQLTQTKKYSVHQFMSNKDFTKEGTIFKT